MFQNILFGDSVQLGLREERLTTHDEAEQEEDDSILPAERFSEIKSPTN